jgi:uncharacterized protein YgbK (DUF1537 family)
MANSSKLKLAFYGDDITGSTDSMEALVLAGVPTVLFLEPPTLDQVSGKFPHIQAVGLAGMSRTMTPAEMKQALPTAFSSLKDLGAPVVHYKVCSTFDSSPSIGSIGCATEIGMEVFKSKITPVVVGAPKLKRFVVFGNHFATINDVTYRLDRHPVMSKHPVTPMDESDLRLHLGKQTAKNIGLLDLRHLVLPDDEVDIYLQKQIDEGTEIIILDTLDRAHLLKVGRLLWDLGKSQQTFVVGSSGVEFALTEYLQAENQIQLVQDFVSPGSVDQIIAISGSASPWTASQIKWALAHGFAGIQMDSVQLVDEKTQEVERNRIFAQAVGAIANHQSVLLYSALGPDDPKIASTKEWIKALGLSAESVGEVLATQQGIVLREILIKTGLRRAAVAGGDTCGYILKQLGIYVLEFIIPLGTAAPLCRASSTMPQFDGMEFALKGGQLGEVDFFASVLKGKQELHS